LYKSESEKGSRTDAFRVEIFWKALTRSRVGIIGVFARKSAQSEAIVSA
jgi:hypothetical protein